MENLALLACDTEKYAYFTYECRRVLSKMYGQPEPLAPSTLLTDAERKELTKLAADPAQVGAVGRLCKELLALLQNDPERATRMPPPFRSLKPDEVQRLQGHVRDPERRAYLLYMMSVISARVGGLPAPVEPHTNLSGELRRQIRKLMTDTRCSYYAIHLCSAALKAKQDQRLPSRAAEAVAATGSLSVSSREPT